MLSVSGLEYLASFLLTYFSFNVFSGKLIALPESITFFVLLSICITRYWCYRKNKIDRCTLLVHYGVDLLCLQIHLRVYGMKPDLSVVIRTSETNSMSLHKAQLPKKSNQHWCLFLYSLITSFWPLCLSYVLILLSLFHNTLPDSFFGNFFVLQTFVSSIKYAFLRFDSCRGINFWIKMQMLFTVSSCERAFIASK